MIPPVDSGTGWHEIGALLILIALMFVVIPAWIIEEVSVSEDLVESVDEDWGAKHR